MTMFFLINFFKNRNYFIDLFFINIINFTFLLFLPFFRWGSFFGDWFIIFKTDKILPCFKLFRLKMLKYFSNVETFAKYIETQFKISIFKLSDCFFKLSLLIYLWITFAKVLTHSIKKFSWNRFLFKSGLFGVLNYMLPIYI